MDSKKNDLINLNSNNLYIILLKLFKLDMLYYGLFFGGIFKILCQLELKKDFYEDLNYFF